MSIIRQISNELSTLFFIRNELFTFVEGKGLKKACYVHD